MAIIQKLRSKSGLMLVVIGGSLLLFVLMDALSNKRGGGLGNDNPNELGEVNGTVVETKDYTDLVNNELSRRQRQSGGMQVDDYTKQQINDGAWEQLVGFTLIEEECDKIGISSSDDEVADIFLEPRNGLTQVVAEKLKINPESVEQLREAIKNSSDATVMSEVSKYEKLIRKSLDARKYQSLVQAAFVATKSEAKYEYTMNNQNVEFEVANLALSSSMIKDADIKVSDEEMQAAYEKDKNLFKQKEGRDIKFLLFAQEASAKDEAALMASMQELKNRFANTTNNQGIFVNSESDPNAPYDGTYHKKNDGLPTIVDSNFSSLTEGQIFGPYQEYGVNGKKVLRVSKVLKVKQLADSVKVKHILISYKNAPEVPGSENFAITTEERLYGFSDSLYKKLQKDPALFDQVVAKHSDDIITKTTGGDIGWVNKTNKFSYMFDSCMLSNGGVMRIGGKDGIHIVKVIQQGVPIKKVNVGTISRELKVSDETKFAIQATANRAADLLKNKKETIDTMAVKNGYRIMQQTAVGKHDIYVQGLVGAREIVKWAYNSAVGDVSNVFDINEYFVVVALEKEYTEGYKAWDEEQVKKELEMKVRNNKKGEILQKKINDVIAKGAKTLIEIQTALPEIGIQKIGPTPLNANMNFENEVIGITAALPTKTMSKAIVGKNGVYVVFVINKSGLLPITDFTQEINEINQKIKGGQQSRGLVESFISDALKTNADIEDYRFEKLD